MWWYGTRCLLLLVLVLPAFQPAAAAVDIAAYYHFTGTYAQFHGADGWGFWARYVNDTYGGLLVGGKREPINLHTWDDKSNLTVVKGLFQMFVDKGYKFVIGGHTTRADLSGSFFDPHKVINIMCCTGPDSYYTTNPRKYMFGIHRSSLDYPKAFLSEMSLRKVRNVAILFNRDVGFTLSTADSAETFARNIGLNVTMKEAYPGVGYTPGEGDGYRALRQHLQTVVATMQQPFALVVCALHNDGQDAAMVAHELGIDAKAVWISVAPTDGPRFIGRVGPSAAEFNFAPTQWDASQQFVCPIFKTTANYVTQFRSYMGYAPSYTSASGTAAAVALHLAIEEAGSLDVEEVVQAFRELRKDTFFGPMAFNRYQRNYGGFTATTEVINGKVEAVLPTTAAGRVLALPPSQALRAQCPAAVYHDNFTECAAELQEKANALNITPIIIAVVAVVAAVLILAALGAYFASQRGKRDNSDAPKDNGSPIAIMFTDIQSSTALWAQYPAQMAEALRIHHKEIRSLIKKHRCYEVKTIGDSFMVVSKCPKQMLYLALDIQRSFLAQEWDPAINGAYKVPDDVECGNRRLWNGLRVRCGLHYGMPEVEFEPSTGGYDYYGTGVNTAARIESVAHGGQIVVSAEYWAAVGSHFTRTTVLDLGENQLRGLTGIARLFQVTPAELGARLFPRLRLEKVQDDDYVSVQTDMLPLHTSGTMDRLHVETVHRKSLSCASSVGAPNFNKHPLVQDGKVSAAELKAQHEACCTSINTLLGTTPPTFRENTFRFLGNHFQVPYHGSGGLERKMFINGLAMRVVPSIIQQKATASEPLNDCTPEAPERPVSQDAGVVPPHHLGTVVPPHHVGPSLGRS